MGRSQSRVMGAVLYGMGMNRNRENGVTSVLRRSGWPKGHSGIHISCLLNKSSPADNEGQDEPIAWVSGSWQPAARAL
jgi:hypothetical protein